MSSSESASKKLKKPKSSKSHKPPSWGNDFIQALMRMDKDIKEEVKTQVALHMSHIDARLAKLEEDKTEESTAKAPRGPQKVSPRFFAQKLLKYGFQTAQGKDVTDKFKKGPLITALLLLEEGKALNNLLEQASRAFVKPPSEALMSNSFTDKSLGEWIKKQRAQASFAGLFASLDRLMQCSIDELNAQLPSKDEASSSSGQKRKATSEAQ